MVTLVKTDVVREESTVVDDLAPLGVAGRRRLGIGSIILMILSLALVVAVVAAPLIANYSPEDIVGPARHAPNGQFWFGTDQLGRDVFARTLFGGRATLSIAAISTCLSTLVGVFVGVISGYFGGFGSNTLMRLMDLLLAFPDMLLALVVVSVGGANARTLTVAVAISFVPAFARMIYGSTRRVRNEEFVLAARIIGCSRSRILVNHVLRTLIPELLVLISSAFGWCLLVAGALSFLGFGVAPPAPEWGSSLSEATPYLNDAVWISLAPGIAMTLIILLSNIGGDRLAGWWQRSRR